jgi:hypothetical protein
MSNLEPRIEAVRAEYGLSKDDFWQIPQNKQWVCKHAALEIVATKASIEWSSPQIIEADTANGIAVLAVSGRMGARLEWATGEASPKNNKNSYPWAMAEKRAKDRVVLKLAGIHGLVYSEDEMPPDEARTTDQRSAQGRREVQGAAPRQNDPPKSSSAEQKRGLEAIEQDLLDCHTIADVNKCAKVWASIMDRDGWSKDFRDIAVPKFEARRRKIIEDSQPVDSIHLNTNGSSYAAASGGA